MKKPTVKSGAKPPAADDEEVWRLASSTIEPLKRKKERFHPAAERAQSTGAAAGKPRPKANRDEPRIPPGRNEGRVKPPLPARMPTLEPEPQLAQFDRRSVRRIRSGNIEIEARIDLHGMRQDEAHVALRAFLLRAHERGLRYVLVITGKGKAAASEEGYGSRERGILKRNVPRWLAEPELGRIVVSHADAAIRHGGDGALYIHIRSKNRG